MTSVADSRPRVVAWQPTPALRPFVRRFLFVEVAEAHNDSHFPDLGAVLAFRCRGDCWQNGAAGGTPRASFTGLWNRLRHHEHGANSLMALVSFTPVGAAAFTRVPLEEAVDHTEAAEHFLPVRDELDALTEKLSLAADHAARVCLLEAFLTRGLRRRTPDPLIGAAVDWLVQAPATSRIGQLATYIGLSQSALERRFRRDVGVTPRRFLSLQRLQRVLKLQPAAESLTALAHDAGYFDQAHFNHEFKSVTGLAPKAYFSAAR